VSPLDESVKEDGRVPGEFRGREMTVQRRFMVQKERRRKALSSEKKKLRVIIS